MYFTIATSRSSQFLAIVFIIWLAPAGALWVVVDGLYRRFLISDAAEAQKLRLSSGRIGLR